MPAGAYSLSSVVLRTPSTTVPGLGGFSGHNHPHFYMQLSCYDQAKQLVLSTGYLSDNIFTHFLSSFIAVSAPNGDGASLAQPLLTKFTS